MPDVKIAEQIATSQSVFAILFIILLFAGYKAIRGYLKEVKTENEKREEENKGREKEIKHLYNEHKTEAKERENKLMDFLEQNTESQKQTVVTLNKIEGNLDSLAKRMDEGFSDVWNQFEKIDKRIEKK